MNLDKLLSKVEKSNKAGFPFVIYKKPGAKKIHALFPNQDKLSYLNDFSEAGFVFAPFNNKEKTVIFKLEHCEVISADFEEDSVLRKCVNSKSANEAQRKKNHLLLVKKGIDFLIKNNLDKVVLSRKEEIEVDHFDLKLVFKNLLANYPNAFTYLWFHPKIGMWMGASPETLIKVNGTHFETMALAGTQNYNGTEKVVWDTKDKQEQQYVTDFIVSELRDFDIKISEPFSKRAGSLIHICTQISGSLAKQTQLGVLINNLHPTPAVCGLPKKEAKAFILKNEKYDREFYTGYLGELNINKTSNLFVNLRCMQLDNKALFNIEKVILYIGGGITTQSNPENEWEETVAKSKVMKHVLIFD